MADLAADASREELRAALIEQLQGDREAALKAGNSSAAVAASRAVADLLALKLRPDEESDEAAPQIDTRQCARAVLALLSEATAESGVSIHFASPGERLIRVADNDPDLLTKLFPDSQPEEGGLQ